MASADDVVDAIMALIEPAVYPNGTNQPSITQKRISIGAGWPPPKDLDEAVAADPPYTWITVWPVPASTGIPPQNMQSDYVISETTPGFTVTVNDDTLVLTGTPNAGDAIGVLINDKKGYTQIAVQGDTVNSFLSALLAQLTGDFPGSLVSGSSLQVYNPTSLQAQAGAPVVMGEVIHSQRQQFRVSIWAPNPQDRRVIGDAVEIALKDPLHINFPGDASNGIMTYVSLIHDDNSEVRGLYINHTTMQVLYDTVKKYTTYPVLVVSVTTSGS